MNMHVAFFIPSFHIGGIENVFITYANQLSILAYKVDFVVCKSVGDLKVNLLSDVTIIDLGNIKLRYALRRLRGYLYDCKPDIVISGGDYPNMMLILASLGLREKPRIVISQHNYLNIEGGKLGFWAKGTKWWIKLLYPFADKILAVSDGIADYLIKDLKISENKVLKIPNPIDSNSIHSKSKQPVSIILPDKYIVFIGRLSVVKNLALLLKAFDRVAMEGLKLIIVGDGNEAPELKEMASTMKSRDNICFVGSMSNPLPILLHASLLVLPSFSEAFPTILLEALCLNKPIVSTPTKGAVEILKNVSGTYLSVDFSDEEVFAKLITRAVKNTFLPDEMDARCREFELDHIIEIFIKQILTC